MGYAYSFYLRVPFFLKGDNWMLVKSRVTGKEYDPEHVWYISNMQQVSA